MKVNRENTTITHNELRGKKRSVRLKKIVRIKDVILLAMLIFIIVGISVILVSGKFLEKTARKRVSQYYLENNAELSGSANVVTSVVVNYRGFDTLGEVTVLFIAATGIGAVLFLSKDSNNLLWKITSNKILITGSRYLFPILLLYGVYIIIHGHLSPGGGFQGGVVIASAFLLLFIGYKDYTVSHKAVTVFESLSGASFVIIGLVGLFLASVSTFLGNFLPHPAEALGTLLSAGIIPVIYALIGVKVGSEMTGLIKNIIN